MRKILLTFLGAVFVITTTLAQDKSVSGKVTAEDGSSLPGVNVVLKGTTTGTVTDSDGNYKLDVPGTGSVIVFSFIGFKTTEMTVGNQSVIDLIIASESTQLTEIVVTAVGISREKASLGYGVTTLKADESLLGRQESDIARVLRGKATGVMIGQTSGLSGSGTNVIIRGYSTISGSNQPLFVVDGVPFNTETNTGNQTFTTGGATSSSRFLDLDPNTIKEITILKGLSATVLYGELGRNGVILVTTKNGASSSNAKRKTEMTFTQSVFRSEVANVPDYQNTFGNGFSAGFGWFFSNWGAAFADTAPSSYGSDYRGENAQGQVLITHPYDQTQYNDDFPQYIGADYPYQPHRSVENFFQAGISSNTSLSISAPVGDNGMISASYSFLTDEGFTPRYGSYSQNAAGDQVYTEDDTRAGRSNYIDKHNLGLGLSTKLANGLNVRSSFNYVSTEREVPITAPAFGGDGNGLFAAIMFTPRSMDLMGLPYQSPIDGSNVYYRRGGPIQNPRWTLNNTGQHEVVRRFFSSTDLSYEITDWLSLAYRLSLDSYGQTNERRYNKGGPRLIDGELRTFLYQNNTVDHVMNALYNFQLSDKLKLDGVVGFNSRRITSDYTQTTSSQQFVFDLFTHQNYIEHDAFSSITEENTTGVYATATLGLENWLYLNLQGRNDWTSTLEKENNSIFYPSASISFIPTDMPGVNIAAFDQFKMRFGYGTSAGYPDPYRTRTTLNAETNQFVTKGGSILNTNSVSNRLGNPNLTAELHQELELGFEVSMLNNLLGFDLSLYKKTSEDLIIDLPLDPATGYTVTSVNGAKVENKGIELGFRISPIRGAVQWNNTINYTKNISNVVSIYEGVERVSVAGYTNLGNVAIPGEPFGVLYGESFLTNADGLLVVTSQGAYQDSGENTVIGDPNPNYVLAWISSLQWKGISFGFMFHYVDGGDIYSSTIQAMLARGNTTDTDVDRFIPLVMPNAVKVTGTDTDGNPTYAPNDIQTYMGDSFFDAYFGADEGGVFDGTVIRLREVSLSYALPAAMLETTPFGNISLSLSAENLWYSAPNFPKGTNFDPEINSVGVGNGRGFDFRTAPTAKKYGFNLSLTF